MRAAESNRAAAGTADDGQTAIRVHITQGDDEDPDYVRLVTKGRYPDGGQPLAIPPYDAGAPIQVVLHYDIDQTIQVEVIDLTAGESLGTFEAVRGETADDRAHGDILDVLRPGYLLGTQLLRPAQVVVASRHSLTAQRESGV